MSIIIKVPSVFSLKLPGGEWLNLGQIRRLEVDHTVPAVRLTWENGDTQTYSGAKAIAIIEAWAEAPTIDKSDIDSDH